MTASSTSTTTPSSPEPESVAPAQESAEQDTQAMRLELSSLARAAVVAGKRDDVRALIDDHGGERSITSVPEDRLAEALEVARSWAS